VTEPGRTYRISVWVAASGVVSHGAFGIVVDPQMQVMPIVVSAGTYGWTQLSGTFVADRSGHTDLRIIAQDRGAIWLTGLEIK